MNEDEGEMTQMKLGTGCNAGEMAPIEDDERDNAVVERDQLPSRGQDQSQARAFTVLPYRRSRRAPHYEMFMK
jgi:hypothetical protein